MRQCRVTGGRRRQSESAANSAASATKTTLAQFRKIKHALDVRAYRTRLKELEARESRKEESDSCVEEGVSCDCANEETSAAAPGGCVAPRRNNEGRGAVDWEATFHSPPSHAPDCLISCEDCECSSPGRHGGRLTGGSGVSPLQDISRRGAEKLRAQRSLAG